MGGPGSVDRDFLLAAVDLPRLADALLGPRHGSPDHPVWGCPEPDHDPDSPVPPHVSVFVTRRGDQAWTCKSCGAGGTAVELVTSARRATAREALEYLVSYVGGAAPGQPTMRRVVPSDDLEEWADRAAALLWQPFGNEVRQWLTGERALPEAVLRKHRVGATSLSASNGAAGHNRSRSAAVLPVMAKGQVVHTQLRLIAPPADLSPYVAPQNTMLAVPRVGLYRPPQRTQPEILVTEGILDALSANAAGYRAAAVLTPAFADAATALQLSRLPGPLVLAFDPDAAGAEATDRLTKALWARGRRPALLADIGHDLNDLMASSTDWPRRLAAHVRTATTHTPPDRVPEL